MATSPADIIAFWFSESVRPLWFKSTAEFDKQLRDLYEPLWQQAAQGKLDRWAGNAEGALALVILLDQIPLNIYRGEVRSFSTEARARDFARQAIDKGLDLQLPDEQKAFLYLPFMHSESLEDQERSVALYEAAGLKENLKFAQHHRDLIRRFGRFPHRNKILGRQSTEAETAYLVSDEAFKG
jgi:uncharacterized protein (DUF924 family)